ncbi:MAG: hypothetical protein LAP21_08370 [Acidobacteriia bacterium]|nr:hypothetical protein [Terriglobia bacterium]
MKSSPLLHIPVERIARELARCAYAGFYGQAEIEISLTPKVLEGVTITTTRQRKVRSQETAEHGTAAETSTERERSLHRIMAGLEERLLLRLETVRIVAHFADGHLNTCDVEEGAGR